MQIRSADANKSWLDFDLSLAAYWSRYIVLDLDLFFAVEARCTHGLCGAIYGDLSWNGHREAGATNLSEKERTLMEGMKEIED